MEKITLNVKEVSEILGIGRTTLYDMLKKNEIPHFRVRGRILFNKEILEEWTREKTKLKEVN